MAQAYFLFIDQFCTAQNTIYNAPAEHCREHHLFLFERCSSTAAVTATSVVPWKFFQLAIQPCRLPTIYAPASMQQQQQPMLIDGAAPSSELSVQQSASRDAPNVAAACRPIPFRHQWHPSHRRLSCVGLGLESCTLLPPPLLLQFRRDSGLLQTL